MTEGKCLVIAEIGNNHNGSITRAKKLVDAAHKAGADFAKFQIRDLGSLYRRAEVEDLGVEYTKELLGKYELSKESHAELFLYCRSVGIPYMCTPWDLASIEFLETLGVDTYKVASADFDNWQLLSVLCDIKKPIILSTGMSSTSDIIETVKFLNNRNANFSLLHCNSTYPAPFKDIELNFIKRLKQIHSHVGYSGHERGLSVSYAAVALGATIIERHLTLDKTLEGPDHQASLLPNEFQQLVNGIREIEEALGPPNLTERSLSQGALLNKDNLGKSITLSQNVVSGDILGAHNLEIKAPGQGISPKYLDEFMGKAIFVNKKKGDFIYWSDLNKQQTWRADVDIDCFWGIPVRPHDVKYFHREFQAPVYEFHISYNDLSKNIDYTSLDFLGDRNVIVHAPEVFEKSQLLNFCSLEKHERSQSIINLQKVCDFSNKIRDTFDFNYKIKIVANVGGYSIHEFLPTSERNGLYEIFLESLTKVQKGNTEIIPQNMAPFPWHFGGQRYQNIFMVPSEIITICTNEDIRICLDTSHLSMYCTYSGENFRKCFTELLPYTSHIHLSDACGLNGEGVAMGTGDVDFSFIKKNIPKNLSFIFETWQGHLNNGLGFKREFDYYFGAVN